VIDEIYNVLNPLATTQWNVRPKDFPSITFHCYSEKPEQFADDVETHTSYKVQVDVWAKNDYTQLVKDVRNTMQGINWDRIQAIDLYENDTKIYHKAMSFIKVIEN